MRGLAMRYRRAGLGAPLAASVKPPEQSPRVSKVTATGEVFNLKELSDFSGNYVAGQAGAGVGGGAGAIVMKNQNGVVMKLTGTGTGVRLTAGAKGLDVKLKN